VRRSAKNPCAAFLRQWLENDTSTWLVAEEILSEYKEGPRPVGRSTERCGANHQSA
jgi:hypothetical protein